MEKKIVVKHSSIVINNYELGDSPRLENFFSIYDPLRHTYFNKGMEYDAENKRLYLMRGIDVYFVERIFNTQAYLDTKADKYDHIEPIMIKCLPRDEVQKEAIRFMLGKHEYSYTTAKSQLGVNLNPGKGKTYISIVIAAYLMIRSMIITGSMGLINQWKDCIQEYTDTKSSEIYIISGSGSIARLLNGMNDPKKYKFILASHSTIKSYGDTYGWDKVGELFQFLGIAMKLYDEAHLNFDNICKIDFHTNTKKTYYLTATPARSNNEENDIYQMCFKNVPSIDLFNENEDPRTAYIAMLYNSKPSPMDISNCKNQYGLDRNAYVNYVVGQDRFYDMLTILMEIILKTKGKTLIFIGVNASIDIVYNWIMLNYPEYNGRVGVYNSTVKQDKDAQLDKDVILSTTKSCGAGQDISGLALTIVLAEPFKSEVLARQSLGRTRAENTRYIEVVDNGFYYIKKYYEYKKPIFAKYATTCSEVKISDDELIAKAIQIRTNRLELFYPIYHIQPSPVVMYNGKPLINVLHKTRRIV